MDVFLPEKDVHIVCRGVETQWKRCCEIGFIDEQVQLERTLCISSTSSQLAYLRFMICIPKISNFGFRLIRHHVLFKNTANQTRHFLWALRLVAWCEAKTTYSSRFLGPAKLKLNIRPGSPVPVKGRRRALTAPRHRNAQFNIIPWYQRLLWYVLCSRMSSSWTLPF